MFYVVKGHVLRCKRAPFTHQKGIFYIAKGALLDCKRGSFKKQLGIFFTKQHVIFLRNNANGTLETRAKENLNHPTYSFRCPHKKKDASPYHAVLKYRKNLKV